MEGRTARAKRRVHEDLDGGTIFAMYKGKAWMVESQSDHSWDPNTTGPENIRPL